MRTIQMTLDDNLVKTVDRVVKKLHTTRSAFTRLALQEAIKKISTTDLEKKHRKGYAAYPCGKTEFSVWENEQDWGNL
ncbi:hypothetical protein MNBD_UNCLBAC01-410 [hydrothermal vent metagenome]|uniref:Uncharacterized protein n=1 Tax=hydrothermal vent metagenome TaxID=652676 RepID=A0A3B1DZD0_9ZZZZ